MKQAGGLIAPSTGGRSGPCSVLFHGCIDLKDKRYGENRMHPRSIGGNLEPGQHRMTDGMIPILRTCGGIQGIGREMALMFEACEFAPLGRR